MVSSPSLQCKSLIGKKPGIPVLAGLPMELGGFMLIGKIDIRVREKILVTIRDVKKRKMIDVRVHHTSEDGEMVATPAGLSFSEDQIDRAVELLKEAKARVVRGD
jgi:hypothetical protein